ncbi:unnamed protein product [Calicophoron daubneyi]|uniref:Lengsin n=1 Tax=Calicophoron daubneyi TaxID=300641 RepID=A0AAV2TF98_CALDB
MTEALDDVKNPITDEEFIAEMQKYDYIRLSMTDMNGLHLSKLVSTRFAKKIAEGHSEMSCGMITFGPRFEVIDIPDVLDANYANGYLIPDRTTLHPCPWAGFQNPDITESAATRKTPNVCSVVCDITWKDGRPIEAYPRLLAKKMIAQLEERYGLTILSAFEPEFRAFKREGIEQTCKHPENRLSGAKNTVLKDLVPFTLGDDMYKTSYLAVYENFFMDFDRQMNAIGIHIQDFLNENGEGQLETPLSPEVGITAADHYFIMKQAVKEIGLKHNMAISFMTAPLFGDSSSGCHYNHSLWRKDGSNAFYDPKEPDQLSPLARHWIAGLLDHLPAMQTLCSPTVNCYRRLHRKLAPDIVNWDIDDRYSSIRVKNKDEKNTYIENRTPSSAANPYLVMAATIAAGMLGIEKGKEPVPPKGFKRVQGRHEPYVTLPSSLHEAIDTLHHDRELVDRLGSNFIEWYVMVKERGDLRNLGKIELRHNSEIDLAEERYEYLLYI